LLISFPVDEFVCSHDSSRRDECLSFCIRAASQRIFRRHTNIVRTRGANFDVETFVRGHFPHFREADVARPFFLITRADRVQFLSRFAADNAAINARLGIVIPFVSEGDIEMSDADETRALERRALLAAVLQATDYCLPAD
jgi:hypothetical protein